MIFAVTENSVRLPAPAATSRLSVTRVRAVPTAVWLGAIVVLSAALRVALAVTVPVPTIFPDELVYWELGQSFADSGSFVLRGVYGAPWVNNGPLYPILIAPTFVVADLTAAYALVKALNAVLMSTAAVPAYFLACRLLSRRAALVAAAATVLVPSLVYTTRVMSENVSYPLFLWAVLAMNAALERPSARRQLLALAAIGLVTLSRGQMAVLLPAFAGSIVLWAWIDPRTGGSSFRRHLRAFAPTWVAVGLAAATGLAIATGSLVTQTAVFPHVRLWLAPAKILWHVADLDLYAGVMPFAAFVLMIWWVAASGAANIRMGIFASVSIATFAALVTLAGVYSTAYPHVYDRYVFYVVPLFFITLLAWAESGQETGKRLTAGIAAIAALLPLTLPLQSLLNGREWGTSTSSVGLIPLVWAKAFVGEGVALRAVLLVLTSALALAFLRTTGRWALARAAIYLLLLFSVMTGVSNWLLSDNAREAGAGELTWVDDAVGSGSTVAILWRGDRSLPPSHRTALRQTEFFNRTVGPVYDLRHPLAEGVPSTHVTIRGDLVVDSAGHPVRAAYVMAHRSLAVHGLPVARDSSSGLIVYRVDGPVRVIGAGT